MKIINKICLLVLTALELNADISTNIKKEEKKARNAFSCLFEENLDAVSLENAVNVFETSYKKIKSESEQKEISTKDISKIDRLLGRLETDFDFMKACLVYFSNKTKDNKDVLMDWANCDYRYAVLLKKFLKE